ncbi:unnamed protein product [Lampetra fluviatilis]
MRVYSGSPVSPASGSLCRAQQQQHHHHQQQQQGALLRVNARGKRGGTTRPLWRVSCCEEREGSLSPVGFVPG